MAPKTTLEIQPLIEHQRLIIETLDAHIAGIAALTAMVEMDRPLVPLDWAHEPLLAAALSGVA